MKIELISHAPIAEGSDQLEERERLVLASQEWDQWLITLATIVEALFAKISTPADGSPRGVAFRCYLLPSLGSQRSIYDSVRCAAIAEDFAVWAKQIQRISTSQFFCLYLKLWAVFYSAKEGKVEILSLHESTTES